MLCNHFILCLFLWASSVKGKGYCQHPFAGMGFPGSSVGKEFTCKAGDPGTIPGLGRSPGKGKGYPLQYSGLKNSMDCIVHGVAKGGTRLSDFYTQAMPAQVLCSFFNWAIGLFCCWVLGVLYIIWILIFYQIYALQVFLLLWVCFHSLIVSLDNKHLILV